MKSKPAMANVLMIVPSAYWLICGIVWIFMPDVYYRIAYQAFAGSGWESFTASNEIVTLLFTHYGRLLGIQFVILSGGLITICTTAYKKGEKWAWLLLAFSNTLIWVTAAIFDAIIGVKIGIVAELAPLLFVYSSLLISKSYVFSKNTGPRKPSSSAR